jgi:hypothetical protein
MNKQMIEENYYRCILDNSEIRNNVESFVENLMYRIFGTIFDLYTLYIFKGVQKFHKYPGAREDSPVDKIVLKGFIKDLIKHEEI